MQTPVQITFRGFPHSEAVEAKVREKAEKLERFYPNIISTHVVVEAEHRHRQKGYLFHVTIELAVPQNKLVISHPHHEKQEHEDVYVAIRDAFDAARRRLEDFARRQRGQTKVHAANG